MAPLRDPGFLKRFEAALPSDAELVGRLIVLTFERDTMSHTTMIRAAVSRFDDTKCAVFRAISASPNLFSDSFQVFPQELSARNTTILERCMAAKQLRIRTPRGTDLGVTIDSQRYRWISNRGVWRPGHFVILPAGEVATFPAEIEGVLVADFAFNVNAITDRDSRLDSCPVTVRIERGRAVKYNCECPEVSRFLDESFGTHCAYNVGELGFGTNFGVRSAIFLNSHINERCPGVHLGFGQHNQGAGVEYRCSIHLDLIAKGGIVWIDADPVPLDLENITPSTNAHPTHSRDEDVFSPEFSDLEIEDCCGVLTADGLQPFSAQCS
jgi:leucyl aminopeptidase (aminopeptidase T)